MGTSGSKGGEEPSGRNKSRQGSAQFGPYSPEEFAQLQGLFKNLSDGRKYMDSIKFRRHFKVEGAEWFAPHMDEYICKMSGVPVGMMTLKDFREGVAVACRSPRAVMIQTLFHICNHDGASNMAMPELERLFRVTHLCSVAAWKNSGDPGSFGMMRRFRSEKLSESVINFVQKGRGEAGVAARSGGGLSLDGFKHWVSERAPLLHTCLATFIHTRCFLYGDARGQGVSGLPRPASELPQSMGAFSLPRPRQPSALLASFEAELFGLAVSHKALQGPWLRLYTSEEDGMSFNRVCFKLLGFGGPTVIVVREKGSGAVFGGCSDTAWKESNSFYGGEQSFLFRLAPDFKVIPPKIGGNRHFQYLNIKGFSLPHGIGMGGTTDSFRFFLAEGLDNACVAKSACLTFEEGELSPNQPRNFEVDALEVWGVGGEKGLGEALEAREKQREVVAAQINKARQVDKSKFANNEFDKEFLLGKTFGGGGNYNSNQDRRHGSG